MSWPVLKFSHAKNSIFVVMIYKIWVPWCTWTYANKFADMYDIKKIDDVQGWGILNTKLLSSVVCFVFGLASFCHHQFVGSIMQISAFFSVILGSGFPRYSVCLVLFAQDLSR
jgi:hypothetical protein